MRKEIIDVLNKHTNVKIDRKFVIKVHNFLNRFRTKDDETINFLGGNLLGVYHFKWYEEHTIEWLEDILGVIDFEEFKTDLHDCKEIVPSRKVTGKPLNHTFLWLAHAALNSKELNKNEKRTLAEASIKLLNYIFFSSIYTNNFKKHRADEGIALALYESLDLKTALKKYQTWEGVFDDRVDSILHEKHGIWYKTIERMDNDKKIVDSLNDIQGRLKSILKILHDKYVAIRDAKAKIKTSDRFLEMEGEERLKDSTNQYESFRRRIVETIPDRNNFINDDLVSVVLRIADTATKNNLLETLDYFSDNIESKRSKVLVGLIDNLLIFTFQAMNKEGVSLSHVPTVADKLMFIFRSSRYKSEILAEVREQMAKEVKNAIGHRADSVIASTRIAVMLYLVIRSLLIK